MRAYLKETDFFNFSHPEIQDFIAEFEEVKYSNNPRKIAVDLYLKIRDYFLYDPFNLDITREGLTFSNVLKKRRAWCVEKAGLMVCCARALNIPARPGYAIVRNHLENEKLENVLQSDLIVFHGYADLYLNGKWVKCTPAFDKRVCRISGVDPLEWDGENDSLFQEHDKKSQRFMEYVHYYGEFEDVPIELANKEMRKYYPHLFDKSYSNPDFKFRFEK
ncbi:MAG: transglutaminase family protein [Crocinitomicaceae bacterium]